MQSKHNSKSSKYIAYSDANNLCGWTMSQHFPYDRFKWLNKKEIDIFDVNSIGKSSPDGYILEVDLKYLNELHELRNYYPFTPENLKLIMICCQNIVLILQIIIT